MNSTISSKELDSPAMLSKNTGQKTSFMVGGLVAHWFSSRKLGFSSAT